MNKKPIEIDTHGHGLKAFTGETLYGKYLVGNCINKGTFGKIFACKDLITGQELIIKV